MTGRARVLLVEDDEAMRESCAQALRDAGHEVVTASSGREAEPELARDAFDAVVTDLRMPRGGGLDVVRVAKDTQPEVPVILITGYPSVASAVTAFKSGVVDYLVKPFTSGQLLEAVDAALRTSQAADRAVLLRRMAPPEPLFPEILGASAALHAVLAEARRAARQDGPVLICGETGSGKELVARAIHRLSARGGGPFVPVNSAAIPESLLEAELFGFERGAFTGAVAAKPGLLEQASAGVLFLDEVGDLPALAQAKLLRSLEEKVCRRVGGVHPRPVDVRVIAATHKDLRDEVAAGRFRQDFYYRISAFEVRVPPLRERKEDIPQLATVFLLNLRDGPGGLPAVEGLSDDALDLLASHAWPGNVRQLQNVVHRALARAKPPLVTSRDIVEGSPAEFGGRPAAAEASRRSDAVDRFEKEYLVQVLDRHEGNVTRSAEALGIHRTTLQRLIKKHRIAAPSSSRRNGAP